MMDHSKKRNAPYCIKKRSYRLIWLLLLAISVLSWRQLLGGGDLQLPFTSDPTPSVPADFPQKVNQRLAQDPQTSKLPLILQKDPRWQGLAYGTESGNNDLAHNGCALVSLAMIQAYWEGTPADPTAVLNWAGNDYYVTGQGTSWEIFSAFATHFGYQFQNLLTSYDRAYELMSQGIPVIVSVAPGTFTTTGHIMVLFTDSNGKLQVYDPNDSPEKRHYEKAFTSETFLNEAVNYWALWR